MGESRESAERNRLSPERGKILGKSIRQIGGVSGTAFATGSSGAREEIGPNLPFPALPPHRPYDWAGPASTTTRTGGSSEGNNSYVASRQGVRFHQGRVGKRILLPSKCDLRRRDRGSARGRQCRVRRRAGAEGPPSRERQAHVDVVGARMGTPRGDARA